MSYKFISAEEAAKLIQNGDNIGFSGFTAAGSRWQKEPWKNTRQDVPSR